MEEHFVIFLANTVGKYTFSTIMISGNFDFVLSNLYYLLEHKHSKEGIVSKIRCALLFRMSANNFSCGIARNFLEED